jgi:hypothetical protein
VSQATAISLRTREATAAIHRKKKMCEQFRGDLVLQSTGETGIPKGMYLNVAFTGKQSNNRSITKQER